MITEVIHEHLFVGRRIFNLEFFPSLIPWYEISISVSRMIQLTIEITLISKKIGITKNIIKKLNGVPLKISNILFYILLLQHRIGFQLLKNSCVWHSENPIDDVDNSISSRNVGLDNGCIDTATFYC